MARQASPGCPLLKRTLHSAREEGEVQSPPPPAVESRLGPVQLSRQTSLCRQWDPSLWLPKPGPATYRSTLHSTPSGGSWEFPLLP